jgi:hypothetical protein
MSPARHTVDAAVVSNGIFRLKQRVQLAVDIDAVKRLEHEREGAAIERRLAQFLIAFAVDEPWPRTPGRALTQVNDLNRHTPSGWKYPGGSCRDAGEFLYDRQRRELGRAMPLADLNKCRLLSSSSI